MKKFYVIAAIGVLGAVGQAFAGKDSNEPERKFASYDSVTSVGGDPTGPRVPGVLVRTATLPDGTRCVFVWGEVGREGLQFSSNCSFK